MPTHIVKKFVLPPTRKVERRICHNEVGFELWVAVIEKSVGIELAKVSFNSTNSEVHLCQFPCGGIGVLPIHGDIFNIPAVILNELRRLNKHTARTAARVRCRTEIDTM